jgi:hypothetical protein
MAYILSRYEPELNTGCWLWTGSTDRYGYGTQWRAGRVVAAHRLFYEQHVGTIPSGLNLRHTCDTPQCCNPAHLVPGTQRENMQDARRKGRALWSEWRSRALAPPPSPNPLPHKPDLRHHGDENKADKDCGA